MKKDKVFQYARNKVGMFGMTGDVEIIEDSGLITEKEADVLWERYIGQVKDDLLKEKRPQMGIWKDCKNETDYHTVEKEVNYIDCEVKGGKIYQIIEKLIT